ncbi:restriction endonuclease subunit S [Subsaximicrobium wynnwilliamsii]|uniref:Restriction endonuclease subunit S n=1 Tax=Subsaximicrobium wynnwilliamsii TaxID=291179 RepID=A0A5C6ZEK0_9FLAO|nr:restriction endonuclease subunit S [Subsaximicrobium wynnwilliamsii]TXD81495.1 restriction endonuclease subunit S [Subsaximicrobium wynnwilliamsii]TXD87162.1 restriction endonuclease subunit S [Subsaximicrobium wynnwilliamsii]TXE00855.1 restriction endonuclease subunit S [Subsaximicrobium wynnwilliamsii]
MTKYETYKDSGVEWIGAIPEHWEVKKIKHFCYVKGRVGWKGLKSSDFLQEGYAYLVTGRDFKTNRIDWKKSYHIDKERYEEDPYIQLENNDLLITKDGTIGKLAIVENLDKPACLNSGIFVVRSLDEHLLTQYLYWVLFSDVFKKFNGYTTYGSTIQHLYQNVFVDFAYPLPSNISQEKIANYLDKKTAEIDDLIGQKKQLLKLYEKEKEVIINQAVTKGINPDVKLKDSGIEWLGAIPAHWEVKKLKYVLASRNHKRIPLSSSERGEMMSKKYDYYGASGVIDKVEDYIFDEPLLLIGEDGANLLTRSKRLVFIAKGRYWVNNHAHILKPKYGLIDYYSELLELYDFSIWVTGSAQPKLTSENLLNIPMVVPPIEEQNQISEFLMKKIWEITQKSENIKKLIALLKEYKTALISDVVTGKIKVT